MRTGTASPRTTFTAGTPVGFVAWLDQVRVAAPATIERRITGVTATARNARTDRGIEMPKAARLVIRDPTGTKIPAAAGD